MKSSFISSYDDMKEHIKLLKNSRKIKDMLKILAGTVYTAYESFFVRSHTRMGIWEVRLIFVSCPEKQHPRFPVTMTLHIALRWHYLFL